MPVIDASLTQWVGEGAPFREVAPLRATQVELSEALREEMRRRPVHLCPHTVHAVQDSPFELDVYLWEKYCRTPDLQGAPGDPLFWSFANQFVMFQSAPPRGGRLHWPVADSLTYEFQSAPPRGGRQPSGDVVFMLRLFQSAPPRGGRQPSGDVVFMLRLFQSAPPRGGRQPSGGVVFMLRLFQSAPPRGGRQPSGDVVFMLRLFQSAPPRGGRQPSGGVVFMLRLFQSAPPRGGRPRHRSRGVGVALRPATQPYLEHNQA